MKPFVINRYGRMVFPSNFFPNLDFSVFRSFHLTGEHRIEARVEASNLTNTPKFGNPTSNVNSGDFMRILSLYGSYAERQIRLAVRYSF